VKQSEDGEVGQGTRIVTAAARQAMAREKARITGKRASQPSALEQAAMAREKEEERHKVSRAEDDVGWKLYNPRQEKEGGKRAATTVTGRVNMAGVCALSRRLMAIEWARALGRKPVDLRARALEQAAKRWAGERARQR
jgi:hypothetical protein